jgi:hypothetical protein
VVSSLPLNVDWQFRDVILASVTPERQTEITRQLARVFLSPHFLIPGAAVSRS